ncbi:MAG: 30S ribosomal protein S13 [Candidatus Pacebacteria bacterium]|nr:30S ribosomal protein S13 [Candidatus Paceibacterota bacterium]
MRIVGITIPSEKRIEIALTTVHGLGRSLVHQILKEANVDFWKKTKDLTNDEEVVIKKIINKKVIEGDLRRQKSANIKRLIDIDSYRGLRYIKKLPVRGQTTRTNSRTVRGNKRVPMGSGKVKVSKK